ncbi:restriction endonuclease subunit S [Lactococcus lactis]|uniref:restriction endonuclease subunit S n=1 Tax=Lactococcus lactis TaxID=1358 RepID=UPI002A17C988|nr:restriction endonuclease subunit S [Lactococcus lactis subsp. lactis]MCT3106608.1 restriction endonuclease subunit S [Lactococcus lactis]
MSKKSPQLRFEGFTDDWEERKFKDNIVSIQTGTNLLGSAVNEGTPLIKMGNLQRGYFSFKKLEYLDSNSNVGSEDIVNYGDFLFNTRNTLELVGKGATWTGISGKYAFNSNIARFKFDGIDTIFFNYLYNTQQVISQVHARAVGTTSVSAVYPRDLNSLLYYLPSIEEQQKIGSFFKQLDNTIALHQRKLDLLKEQKKGYLQKMFPKNGAKVPELRFAGFADDWEERKFGEVWKKSSERNLNLEYSPKQVLSVAQMKLNPSNRNEQDDYMKTYNVLHKGDIAFEGNKSKSFAFGRFVLNDLQDGIVSHVFNVYRPICKMDTDFMKVYINNESVMKYLLVKATTKTLMMTTLNTKDIVKQKLNLPSLEEQQKIGSFFKQLDKTIALHQRKLDLLKEQKKGFLQKMFV